MSDLTHPDPVSHKSGQGNRKQVTLWKCQSLIQSKEKNNSNLSMQDSEKSMVSYLKKKPQHLCQHETKTNRNCRVTEILPFPPTKTIKLIIVCLFFFTEKSMLVLSFKQTCLSLLVSIKFTRLIRILLLPYMINTMSYTFVGRWRENKKSSATKWCCLGVTSSSLLRGS